MERPLFKEKYMIYFIKTSDDKFVKIGYTQNISNRISQLQTSSPSKLELIFSLEGDQKLEEELHKRYQDYKTDANNEWFHYTGELSRFISELKHFIRTLTTITGHDQNCGC